MIGLLADVISANRKLLEDLVYRVRSLELPAGSAARETGSSAEREPVAPGTSRAGVPRTRERWER
jgi:hypothetical protein